MLDYIVFRYFRSLHELLPSGLAEIVVGLPVVFAVCAVYWFIRRAWHKRRLGADFAEVRRRCRLNELVRLLFTAWLTMLFLLCLTTDPGSLKRLFSEPLLLLSPVQALYSFTSFDYRVFPLERTDMILNTALFVPLGVALPVLWKKADLRMTVLVGFALTYFIELRVQPFIDRYSSIDDIIANTLGAFIGYLIFALLRKVFPRFIEKCRVSVNLT